MTYQEKFAGLLKAIKEARSTKAETLVIAFPEALGDDYNEIIESMNRISDAGLSITIVPRKERGPKDTAKN